MSRYVSGTQTVLNNLRIFETRSLAAIGQAVETTCVDISNDAKADHRRGSDPHSRERFESQTGSLIRSIFLKLLEVSRINVEGVVYSNLRYAPDIELGNVKHGAYPFMHPALVKNYPNFQKRLALAFRKVL